MRVSKPSATAATPRNCASSASGSGAGKLGEEWELPQLLAALSAAGRIEPGHVVLPRLAGLSCAHNHVPGHPGGMVLTRPNSFRLQQEEASIRAILKAGLNSGNLAAAETVIAVVSLCIAEGFDLRDGLDAHPQPG